MLEKVQVVDRIEVVENGCVQVRTRTSILEDGKQISGTYHRHVVAPGADYSNEDARVQAICVATHTPEVVAAYQAMLAAQAPLPAPLDEVTAAYQAAQAAAASTPQE